MIAAPCQGQTLYDFGNPSAEEQLYIEFINRARKDPPAEGVRLATTTDPAVISAYTNPPYWTVDLAMMQSEFNLIGPQPPLAPNANLTTAARSHSAWMLANATQAHNETNPSNTPFTRMTAAGYTYSSAGENIYATAKSIWYGHAGFEVDWGGGDTGGMQAGRGHRANIHSSSFREIGVGVTLGTNGGVGPQLVTQDFGRRSSSPTFGTGVAYYDLNANDFYDLGEGIAGLTVNVNGASYYCTSAIGGGWVVPVPTSAATRTVTFSGLNMNQTASLVVPSSTNAKADLKLTYAPPAITSSSSATGGSPHTITFTAVGGAASYKWKRWDLATATAENCENTANITAATTGTYSVLNTSVKQQGTASFHLENSTGASQSIQLNGLYYGQNLPLLEFQSSVRWATGSEHLKVQIKEEGSLVWQDVYDQTGGTYESSFSLRSASLSAMTGKAFRVRFILNFSSGSYYTSTGNNVGWFIDAISLSGVSAIQNEVSQTLTATSGAFTPTSGTYLMSVTPVISSRDFPASYQTLTVSSAIVTLPTIDTQPASLAITSGNTATFTVAASGGSLTYQWYAGNSGVTSNPVSGATASTFTTPALTATAGYWVRVGNSAGVTDSNTASATVVDAVAILSQPVSTTISKNTTTTLSVAATGTSPAFQWYSGGTGVTITPIAGATGSSYTTPTLTGTSTYNYWVRVSNAAGFVNSVTATITTINGAVTRSFSTWAAEIELANSLPAGSITNGALDFDKDGRSNLIEYAFGCSPIIGNDPAPRMPLAQNTATHFVLSYQRDTALADLTFTAQACSALGDWKTPGETGAPTGFSDALISTSGTVQTREATIPRTSGASCFMRMQITKP